MKNKILFCSFFIFLIANHSIAQSCFSTVNYLETGFPSYQIINADFNNDTFEDLINVIPGSPTYKSTISLGLGNGTFAAPTILTNIQGVAVAYADFNEDGNLDISTVFNSRFTIFFGNGSGTFTIGPVIVIGTPVNFSTVVTGDFNEDGNIDIASPSSTTNYLFVVYGNGSGSFSSPTSFLINNITPDPSGILSRITSADFNGDNHLDMAISFHNLSNISVMLGNGSGGFLPSSNLTVPFPRSVQAGDLNGDGILDLVSAGGSGTNTPDQVAVFIGLINGNFSTPVYYGLDPNGLSGAADLIIHDLNDDGKQDIVVAGGTGPQNRITIFYGQGNGNLTFRGYLQSDEIIFTITGADFNNDGKWDIAGTINDATETNTSIFLGLFTVDIAQTNVSCHAGSNGSATANVTCGTGISYSWNTTPTQTTQTAIGLTAGTYTVTVTDFYGTTKNATVTITEPPLLTATITIVPNTKCSGTCNGSAVISNIQNAPSPFNYQWDSNTGNQVGVTATSLCHGNYSVIITDSNGCQTDVGFEIPVQTVASTDIFLTNLAAVDQISVSPAFTNYYIYNLPASITPPPSNLRNFVDPGKKARFKVECTNNKANGQSIVSGICKVFSNSPYLMITDNSSALNNVAWNNNAWSADEFEVEINPNTPAGTNAYIDFVVQENAINYTTSCIPIPIHPLVYSPTNPGTIDDDSNPDSQGNDNNICEPNEIIEFYPLLDNVSTLDARFVRGRFENLDNLSFINIWNNVPGVNTTVFDTTWWNYAFAQPQTINATSINTSPEYDFVFNYNNTSIVNNFKLYMVMAGGFKLFAGTALSLVQWTLPFGFNSPDLGVNTNTKKSINIYPNPSIDFITIENENYIFSPNYDIVNNLGQSVSKGKLTGKFSTIDISKLTSGVYIVQIGDANKQTFKLIKK